MSDEFDRIKRLPPYVFAEVNRLKAMPSHKAKILLILVWVILICPHQNILEKN